MLRETGTCAVWCGKDWSASSASSIRNTCRRCGLRWMICARRLTGSRVRHRLILQPQVEKLQQPVNFALLAQIEFCRAVIAVADTHSRPFRRRMCEHKFIAFVIADIHDRLGLCFL